MPVKRALHAIASARTTRSIHAAHVARAIVGMVFAYAGAAKAIDPDAARTALAFILPSAGPGAVSILLAVQAAAEVWIGVSLLVRHGGPRTLVATAVLLGLVTLGYAVLRAGGYQGDCGCSTPVDALFGTETLLWRNAGLAALILIAAIPLLPSKRKTTLRRDASLLAP